MTQLLFKNSVFSQNSAQQPKPILKWTGGKTQLLPEILKRLPCFLKNNINHYIEPFFGGGAVFFDNLYSDSHIHRIEAKRIINANADKRGKIFELLITDYDTN